MLALQIENIREFMKKLLLQPAFDSFLVSEASVVTFASFSIDGTLKPEFFPPDKAEQLRSEGRTQILWSEAKPFCLSLIRGQQLPINFHVILQLPPREVLVLLEENALPDDPDDIFGLFLNIRYHNELLTVTTGSSRKTFSRDRQLDAAWDRYVREMLTREGLL